MSGAPLTLYLDLERGQKADLETVASASLALTMAIRDIAYVIDPSIEIRVELDSGTKGSLKLNTRLKEKGAKLKDPKVLAAIVLAVMGYFRDEIGDFVVHKVLDAIYEEFDSTAKPTKQDVAATKASAERIIKGHVGEQSVRQVYRTVERDRSIRGIGAGAQADTKPDVIIPRDSFASRAGYSSPVEVTITRRERVTDESLTIIKPVLEHAKRKWRFRGLEGEFGAEIDDEKFIDDTLSGRHPIPMVEGVQLRVQLLTTEEQQEGVWKPIDHRILKVYGYNHPPKQTALPFAPPPANGSDDDDEDN